MFTTYISLNENKHALLFLLSIVCVLSSRLIWAKADNDYWLLPIPLQGNAPATYHPITHDISPKSCALCHKKQANQWQSSYHAKAASPGLIGQLHYFDQGNAISCLSCHTPRSEQINDWQDQTLKFQATGIDCASCHLRQHQRYGANEKNTSVHGTVQANALFKQSNFCSRCHQFTTGRGSKLAGKFLENTYQEWQQSPWSEQGVSCQSCHMPKGSHRFKGIHDADMTRRAFKIEAVREATGFSLLLKNQFAGHALPTYATPRIVVTLESSDKQDKKTYIIQRQLFLNDEQNLQQKADTRLQAGESIKLFLPLTVKQQATATIKVEPDYFYQQVIYPYFLEDNDESDLNSEDKQSLKLLLKAKQISRDYILYDIQCPRWQVTQPQNHNCTLSPQLPKGDLMPSIKDHST